MGEVSAGSPISRSTIAGGPSTISVVDIQAEAKRLLNASLTVNTVKAYDTGLKALHTFRQTFGLAQVWPPSVQELTSFIAYLSLSKYSYR